MGIGTSIGDLYVKLGFDVDDAKLKSFDQSIKDVFGTVLKIAGVGGGVAGFIGLAKGAEETALQITNLTTVYGTSAKAIQAWGAAVHESNPLKSYAEGISSFGSIAEYLKNAAYTPQGASSLNRLGVSFSSEDVQHPERIIDKLFETIPKLLAAHPEQRGLYSSLIGDVTGDATNIRIFEKGRAFQEAAASRTSLYDDDLKNTVRVAQDIAELENQWDRFFKHAIGLLAEGTIHLEKNIKEHGWVDGIGITVDELGAADPYNLKGARDALINNKVMNAGVDATSKWLQGNNPRGESREFWQNKGYTWGQVSAWLGQEEAESDYGTNPNMNKGKYKGAFQWSPERRAAILAGSGIDVEKVGHIGQLEAADWEFRHMGLEEKFKQLKNERDASKFLSDKFEIHEKFNKQHGDETAYRQNLASKQAQAGGDTNMTVHQVIYSNADAQEVARLSQDRIDRMLRGTYTQQTGTGF